MPQKVIIFLLWFSRLAVGVLFLVSGLIKVNDITGFAYKLTDYFNVFEDHFGLPAGPRIAGLSHLIGRSLVAPSARF